jgi:pyruvate kinase
MVTQKAGGRRTKIVCTIGPSSNSPEMLSALIDAGMNMARLNFSHGNHQEHQENAATIRRVARSMGRDVGIMVDLQGPKIRTGKLQNSTPLQLIPGETICLTTRNIVGDSGVVSTTYESLASDIKSGDSIFLADGVLELLAERVEPPDVHCRVIHGGFLGEHKGINLPGVNVSAPCLTPKDIADLDFALSLDIDFIALSFVRNKNDIVELRKHMARAGKTNPIVAKIERPEALKNFDKILQVADTVMLARGDLGVEMPLDQVPQIQKSLIGKCNDVGVPVITATQMLESMISSARPTRAEVADVANAVYDGTDALMLSGETASGQFPVQSVRVMGRIAEAADNAMATSPTRNRIIRMRESGIRKTGKGSYGDAISQAACRTAAAIGATRIVCFTKRASTAALIARYRPSVPVTAITLNEEARHRCSVVWGVDAVQSIEPCNTDELDRVVDDVLLDNQLAKPGDTVIVAGGIPLAMRTRTNMLKLHKVRNSK